ncbi:hypothetical protein IMZ48_40580 [Candidatus Bathyarchaeota archaeon]|nr:hypothetical protein [Candidatus Bathyarchaeota archaeon]
MVSSLPFLAPFFVRKAKQYRSRPSGYNYGSYGRSKDSGKGSQAYKLSNMSGNDGLSRTDDTTETHGGAKESHAYATTTATATATRGDSDGQSHSWSDEDMLRRSDDDLVQRPNHAIMKSVSYTVEVNHRQQGPRAF